MNNNLEYECAFSHDSSKDNINTQSIFEISFEGEKLRVKNENINCLYSNLDPQNFDSVYNEIFKCLNLDFSAIEIGNKSYQLSNNEQQYLVQKIITSWIYYYSINGLKIKVTRSDFEHPCMIDYVLYIIDEKYGTDTDESLILGAKILRHKNYLSAVKSRRRYYDR